MNRPLRITVAFLGLYAGIVGIQHGIFEMLQGNTAPDGLMFSAIGPPCRPETVWHACFPALSRNRVRCDQEEAERGENRRTENGRRR